MKIIRNKVTIHLTEREREAIEIVRKLADDIFYDLSDSEIARFNNLMKASWNCNANDDTNNIEVGILDFSCLLDSFQKNIDEFNKGG